MQATLIVKGKVQGVGFRYIARSAGVKNDIKGAVRNKKDGSVEIFLDTDKPKLERFIEDLRFFSEGRAQIRDIKIISENDPAFSGPWCEIPEKFKLDKKVEE